ncbi:methylated-DNA--[protein]-cysteine S-methyltransferase [Fodinicurvata halophila]|uniref:methylated-DNA--[protein]-cysteine S-methyltransferase n=1 Tax=Fodinicurvata halophila TaxID=1419723 RepID=UPI00362819EC
MTPATYARGGRNARIVYGLADSPLGQLLVAATEHGLCFIALGDDPDTLEAELRNDFPAAAELRRDQDAVEEPLAELLAYLAGQVPHFDLPLDIRATAFQRRVWNELVAIPYGETRSYAEIAERLGLPRAQRAVGRACGSNPVSLVIPCHRVLRSDGDPGGYRWGWPASAACCATKQPAPQGAETDAKEQRLRAVGCRCPKALPGIPSRA